MVGTVPESIKQLVVSAFADHDPLLLSALTSVLIMNTLDKST